MIKIIWQKFYPVFSLVFIETGKIIEKLQESMTLVIILLQILIGILTIIKIYKDIKNKKYKSIEKEEKEIKQKYPFLTSILDYLTKHKKNE